MRYRLLDTLRGISVVSMILFHACWDLVNLYHFDWPWFQGTAGHVWQQSICWAFILISGFCMGLKKEDSSGFASCKRGLILLAAGILVTVSTFLFTPESPIIFGVLFFLGCAMLLTTALMPLLRNCSGKTGLLLTSLLFFLLRRQQLRTELWIEQLTGMTIEGDDHRCQMMEFGIGNHTIDYLLMPCMNTVEHADGGNAFQQHSCLFYVANNLH